MFLTFFTAIQPLGKKKVPFLSLFICYLLREKGRSYHGKGTSNTLTILKEPYIVFLKNTNSPTHNFAPHSHKKLLNDY